MKRCSTLNTHIGTHIDAPRHFYADGPSITDLRLEPHRDARGGGARREHKPPARASPATTWSAPASSGAGQIAVIKTLWTDRAWGTPQFWGTRSISSRAWASGSPPGRAAVAMDCFPEKPFWRMTLTPAERGANHKRWLKAGIPMIQMLTNLERIGGRFHAGALPLRLQGHGRRPARVVGIED
jgi:kynurenine formamidase